MRMQPKKGRYFVISPGRTRFLVKQERLFAENGRAVKIVFKNPEAELARAVAVVEFAPGRELSLFSLPVELADDVGTRLMTRAIAVCGQLNCRALPSRPMTRATYVIFYDPPAKLRTVERCIRFQKHKYRGDAKFSNAFKARPIHIDDVVVRMDDVP